MRLEISIEVPERGHLVGMDYCHDGQWRVYFRGDNGSFFASKGPTIEEAARLAAAKLEASSKSWHQPFQAFRDRVVGQRVRAKVKLPDLKEDELLALIGAALKR